jgi:hypothetical protein
LRLVMAPFKKEYFGAATSSNSITAVSHGFSETKFYPKSL